MDKVNFGQAIEALKQGKRVAREGWNGKGMYVFMQIPSSIPNDIIPKMQSLPESVKRGVTALGGSIKYENQFCIVKPRNEVTNTTELNGWAPSGSDALADDWYILADIE